MGYLWRGFGWDTPNKKWTGQALSVYARIFFNFLGCFKKKRWSHLFCTGDEKGEGEGVGPGVQKHFFTELLNLFVKGKNK